MADFLVGCDVGTGGTKAVVMDTEGNVLGTHYIEYPLITAKNPDEKYPGAKAEHDPEWYWNAVADTIQVSIKQSKVNPKDIKGVSISALSPACILVDKDLNPLQNAHIWMDRRATAECDWLKKNIGEERIFKLSANPTDPYYATAKLMWEKNNRPDLYKKAYKFQTAADYPCMKLTGKAVTDYSNASLIGIAFDIVNRKWDNDLLVEIGLDPDKFPEAFPCDEVIGEVTREAAERTGLAVGTPVVAGTVDCNAAWVAGGAVDAGSTQLVMGTAGVLGVVHDEPTFTRDMITIIHTADSRTKYTTLAALVSCGALIRYFRDNFGDLELATQKISGISAYDIMNEEAKHVPAGSNGLITLPYFMGERTPIWDTHARGVLFGLSLDHGRGHVIRSFMEGAGFGLLHNFELMRESGVKMNLPMILSEGGANSPMWRQIISDILNIECAFAKSSKGAPVGNAVAAGVGVGIYKNYDVVKGWVQLGEHNKPNPENQALYRKLYAVYRDLYPSIQDYYVRVAEALA
ncbi:MAG TPA: FGGY-family carbohydrate kinase [Candidatus Hydrogenedentes bacterium]|nr:FGGY-family carbohydrate kinase [Candidatus Hydrogenedentota bacterium]HOS02268.1 FGGY-family carbohydrate kinase [Candidatus Hydrogenedentota bacterium]